MRRCIYADSLLTKIKAYRPYQYLGEDALSYAIKMVELEPSADVRENVSGEWIDERDPLTLKCSECGYRVMRYNNTNFCPNCGADMRGES